MPGGTLGLHTQACGKAEFFQCLCKLCPCPGEGEGGQGSAPLERPLPWLEQECGSTGSGASSP